MEENLRVSCMSDSPAVHHTIKEMHGSWRHLPHLYVMEQPLFVTFRIHGSLPPGRAFPKQSMSSVKAFVSMDGLLDNLRSSPAYLREPTIAPKPAPQGVTQK